MISLAIIQAGFQFHDVYRPLSSYQFKSKLFSSLQEKLGAISFLPVPLPYSYLLGLDWVVFNDGTGTGHGRVYLLGERRQGDGFPSYYLIAVLFKVPIAGLLLFGAALVHLWRKRKWRDMGYPLHSGDPNILWLGSRGLGVPVGDDRSIRHWVHGDCLLHKAIEEFSPAA